MAIAPSLLGRISQGQFADGIDRVFTFMRRAATLAGCAWNALASAGGRALPSVLADPTWADTTAPAMDPLVKTAALFLSCPSHPRTPDERLEHTCPLRRTGSGNRLT